MSTDRDFELQLKGYSLTTSKILYRLPDYQHLLQWYLWQEYDVHPGFPKLKGFLDFWASNLEGQLHSVVIVHRKLIAPAELKILDGQFSLN